MIQPSQKLLVADLQAAGAHYLATRAAGDEFHDFKSTHEMPQHELMVQIDAAIALKAGDPDRLRAVRENVTTGKYDATKAESDEWMASAEGQEAMKDLGPNVADKTETCPDCGLPRGYEARCTSAWHDRPVADKRER